MDYQEYLKIDELLDLQQPLSAGPEHDEPLFIIIHQVYELWFKILLHEGQHLASSFKASHVAEAGHTLRRMRTVLKTLVSQVDILETMTPLSFSSFRDRLQASSGFQSLQFRKFEFMLGAKNPRFLSFFDSRPDAQRQLQQLLESPSLYDLFLRFMEGSGVDFGGALKKGDSTLPPQSNLDVQKALLGVYRQRPDLAQICELMVDLDEGIQEWRYRHVKMVERTIGTKKGTGGSAGAEYLKKTLFHPLFPDLWEVRSMM